MNVEQAMEAVQRADALLKEMKTRSNVDGHLEVILVIS